MTFQKYIAIDWSGENKRLSKKIQVAQYDPADRTVSIVRSCERGSNGRWSRTEVLEQVRRWVKEKRALIGFDFAFAYPYCDEGEYFPGQPGSSINVRHLWKTVESVCERDNNFYGGQFYLPGCSMFSKFHHFRNPRHPSCQLRLRATEKQAKNPVRNPHGLDPSSVFNCVGQKQVGPGSIAGMRFLLRLRRETNASIWPFDAPLAPHGSVVVEIYPTLFRAHAGISDNDQPNDETREKFRDCYGANLEYPRENWRSKDERDALVSAAGMARFANQPATWQAPTLAAKYEGWIFGVR